MDKEEHMEVVKEIRNAEGRLICKLKKTEQGSFCETKGKHTQAIPLDELKLHIMEFERN